MDHSELEIKPADPKDHVQFSLDQTLDAATGGEGKLNLQAEGLTADPALVRLHELLGFPPVALPPNFAERVMGRVRNAEVASPVARPSVARSSWLFAIAGAAGLLLGIVLLGGIESNGDSVFAGLAAGMASVVLAGAGMLAATWSGVGVSVGSWVGTSPTVGAFIALAFVGSLLGLTVLLGFTVGSRRARQRGDSQ